MLLDIWDLAANYTNYNRNVDNFRFIEVQYKSVKFKRLSFRIYEDRFGSMLPKHEMGRNNYSDGFDLG